MAMICRFPKGDLRLHLLLGLLLLMLAACQEDASPSSAAADTDDISVRGFQEWSYFSDSLDLQVIIGSLLCDGKIGEAPYIFQDSIVVKAQNRQGKQLVLFKAREARTEFPYTMVRVRDFLWECEDGTQIEGADLFWNLEGNDTITVEGELQLITPQGLVIGENLTGDILMRRYEIQQVHSVKMWDAIAGGREGYYDKQ